ncbi:glycoside hydrolase family 13 protein [Cyclonatronum proteinivorum]|nr:glycoside hydrolase family 13 protein [Cyclonatronum proteinivorum]
MMIRKFVLGLLFFSLCAVSAMAQRPAIERVEPPHWWIGFNQTQVQLLVHGPNIGNTRVNFDYPGVDLVRMVKTENPNYLFVYLNITDEAEPGTITLHFDDGRRTLRYDYEIKARLGSDGRHQGFDSSDVIYLLMPDRFANGDPTIDNIPGMIEGVDMDEPFARKGGDIQGILDNLDYIKDLGMTAIWLNPIFENDMPYNYAIGAGFYHGYAATDMYRVDRRFGSNEDFRTLVNTSQEMGMKVIMDKIHNHVGTHHWFIKDLPSADWIHDQEVYGNTSFRTNTIMDPYASVSDFNSTVRAWFVDEMPDLDQRNPLVADYLIQNTLWWIEEFGIDGIRMDTHAYPYPEYMAEWTRIVLDEYPTFNIVGEVWMPDVPTTAWWQFDSRISGDYNSHLPSVTDFPLFNAIARGLNEDPGWESGLTRIYYTLGQDFLYTDPLLNVIFVDNHDLTRFADIVNRDPGKFKMGLSLIYTTRGIPQIFYGTEIMMDQQGMWNDPGKRHPFPGGWPGDEINAFTHEGRVQLGEELGLPVAEMHEFVRTLTHWRNGAEVIHNGRLRHFIPEENIYVYFRYNEDARVMVILNGQDETQQLDMSRFIELTEGFTTGTDVSTGREVPLHGSISLSPLESLILEME